MSDSKCRCRVGISNPYAGLAEAMLGEEGLAVAVRLTCFTTRTCECGWTMSAASLLGVRAAHDDHREFCAKPILKAETRERFARDPDPLPFVTAAEIGAAMKSKGKGKGGKRGC